MKKKIATALIILSTIAMAGIAIFSGIKLYQMKDISISPVSPESQPVAQTSNTSPCEVLAFSISGPSPTSSPTTPPTTTPTQVPIQTQQGSSITPGPQEEGTAETNSLIAQASPTSTIKISQEALPSAGVGLPTILLSLFGIIVIFVGSILAI